MAVAQDAAWVATGTIIARLNHEKYAVNSHRRHQLEMDIHHLSCNLRDQTGAAAVELRKKIAAAQSEIDRISEVGFNWKINSPYHSAIVVARNVLLAGGDE